MLTPSTAESTRDPGTPWLPSWVRLTATPKNRQNNLKIKKKDLFKIFPWRHQSLLERPLVPIFDFQWSIPSVSEPLGPVVQVIWYFSTFESDPCVIPYRIERSRLQHFNVHWVQKCWPMQLRHSQGHGWIRTRMGGSYACRGVAKDGTTSWIQWPVWQFFSYSDHGVFTLTVTETETETDNKYTELNGNLCCYPSLCSMNTSIQFHRT